jgi:hypothetical protein
MEMQAQTNPQSELPLLLLLETVVVHIEADIRWLETCNQQIADLKQLSTRYTLPTTSRTTQAKLRKGTS